MATYNRLPTDLTANIFTYLRRERRRPPHFTAMNDLINKAADPFIERPALYRGAEATLNAFINRPAGDLHNSEAFWNLHELMEFYDGDNLFNNKTSLYDIGGNKPAFYITYIIKAGLLNSEP
jgi:hypothetical protein